MFLGTTVLEENKQNIEVEKKDTDRKKYVCIKLRVIQWIRMLNMDEDDILEGISGLLLSQKMREKSIKSLLESFNNSLTTLTQH